MQQTSARNGGDASPKEIEALLERDRNELSETLAALKERFSPDALWRDGVSLVSANAGPYTQTLDRAIRGNPMGVAVTAIGLAWLILARYGKDADDKTNGLSGTKYEAVTRWEGEGGPVDAPMHHDDNDEWMDEADRLRSRAGRMLDQIKTAARKGLTPESDLARSRTDVMAALTKDVRRAMERGLGGLTGSAREAAVAARERAYEVHLRTGAGATDRVRRNPVQASVVLAAAGMALALMIPQSNRERQLMGAPRDRLLGEVKRVMSEERQRLSTTVAQAAKSMIPDPQTWTSPGNGGTTNRTL